ncbi:MAG: hypothetical protein Q7S80_01390 [bacterium]|nr:hypothetical protein [bacterium]
METEEGSPGLDDPMAVAGGSMDKGQDSDVVDVTQEPKITPADDRLSRAFVAEIDDYKLDDRMKPIYEGYAGMLRDPMYDGRKFLRFNGSIFGYDVALLGEKGDIEAIGSAESKTPELHVGDNVVVQTSLYGVYKGEKASVVSMCEPFVDGSTDHILEVQTEDGRKAWLKPSEITRSH